VVRRTWYFSENYIIQHAIQSNVVKTSLGDLSGEGTPGPIPNPVVKLVSADGTWRATSWESRSLPRGFSFNSNDPPAKVDLFFNFAWIISIYKDSSH
jgi:hypothetical protein